MKMNQTNPGGEGHADLSMKGCQKYQARGAGDLKPFSGKPGMGSDSLSKGGNVQKSGHVLKSFSGSTVSTTHTAAK